MKKIMVLVLVATVLTGCGDNDISKSNNELNPNGTIQTENMITENIITEEITVETWDNSPNIKRWD